MKIPNRVKIFDLWYDVIICYDKKEICTSEECDGIIHFPDQEIKIYKGSSEKMFNILLHEILHAIIDGSSIDLPDEEITIQALANGLGIALKSILESEKK